MWWLQETEASRPHLLVQVGCLTYPEEEIERVEQAAQALHRIFSGHREPQEREVHPFNTSYPHGLNSSHLQRGRGENRTLLTTALPNPAHSLSVRPQPGPGSGPEAYFILDIKPIANHLLKL